MAGDVVAFGSHHRGTAIRKINPGHWEVRCVDATANMCLSCCYLQCWSAELSDEEPLAWQDVALTENASVLDKAERMPATADEALDALDGKFEDIEAMMESKAVKHYLEIKRWESN